ncbi:GNAT family protein [Aliiroseovarius sp. F20344]|uniref:GNAT family N-acetyltransferase n=1 Tax=Aliiroseovarius sp. F20344 TaxID=2926414 RepID=UPI001FF47337|nr:GNAT family protein [Aliiroseovarius sp. F20344]MCK0143217.1 GNAT family N-acetyltransferase [Aliiroseovarius sp. F20344]
MWPAPVTLSGDHVTLAPLSLEHAPALKEASAVGALHRLWYTTVPTPKNMETEITRRLALQDAGTMLPFCVMTPDGTPVGMTTFMNIDAINKRVEIGSTWYRKSVQRSLLNAEAKRLLLSYAFDDLGCIAVELRTHFMNHQSRAAIERLGAKLDGVLRSHMDQGNGVLRDTAVYSIIASEWPAVRANLTWRLEKPRN